MTKQPVGAAEAHPIQSVAAAPPEAEHVPAPHDPTPQSSAPPGLSWTEIGSAFGVWGLIVGGAVDYIRNRRRRKRGEPV